jgi:hypothetical protein
MLKTILLTFLLRFCIGTILDSEFVTLRCPEGWFANQQVWTDHGRLRSVAGSLDSVLVCLRCRQSNSNLLVKICLQKKPIGSIRSAENVTCKTPNDSEPDKDFCDAENPGTNSIQKIQPFETCSLQN